MDSKPKYPNVEVNWSGLTLTYNKPIEKMLAVKRALRRAGVSEDEIAAFRAEAMPELYGNLLEVCERWVEVN